MANRKQQKGPCYKCGKEMAKGYMGRHLLAEHYDENGEQKCYLLKIEDEYSNYWLFVDVPVSSSLSTLDSFLRSVWLECCGHMSAFYVGMYEKVGMNKKIGMISEGSVLRYDYDFGSTTELKISFVGTITRKKQKSAVRLLIRNEAPDYTCSVCGKKAESICTECIYETENPFFCEECEKSHCDETEHYTLPVVNSPRMGVCGYAGEYDTYTFNPDDYKNSK